MTMPLKKLPVLSTEWDLPITGGGCFLSDPGAAGFGTG